MNVEVGQPAPPFTLATADGEVSLAAVVRGAERGVIVYFYPAAMTPGCTTEACDFRDSLNSLASAGYSVVGISPDQPAKLRTFAEKENLNFPLASDPDNAVAKAYGAFGEKKLYGRVSEGVIRSTFVIAPDGTVSHAYRNVRAAGHVARVRRDLGLG
ncbi:MAG: thioredoxin-dependent thiol peroxidase [Actinomycetales bacterium]|nr:thioredoxin-dependent thiol peroxidase [Actinomycetales bacterium]